MPFQLRSAMANMAGHWGLWMGMFFLVFHPGIRPQALNDAQGMVIALGRSAGLAEEIPAHQNAGVKGINVACRGIKIGFFCLAGFGRPTEFSSFHNWA